MRINFRSQSGISALLVAHVRRRIYFELGRFSSRIKRVTIRIAGMEDGYPARQVSCSIIIQLDKQGVVDVCDFDGDITAAIDRAIGRAARSVVRSLAPRYTDGDLS